MDSRPAPSKINQALVGDRVKKANRSAIARDTNISLSGVSRILSGNRTASAHNLSLIAACLGVDMGSLYFYLAKRREKVRKRSGATAA